MREGESHGSDPHFDGVCGLSTEATLRHHFRFTRGEARKRSACEAFIAILEVTCLSIRAELKTPDIINSVHCEDVHAYEPAALQMHMIDGGVDDEPVLALAHLEVEAKPGPPSAV